MSTTTDFVGDLQRRIAQLEKELADAKANLTQPITKTVFVVFDGPPSHESGRFVETEDEHGNGISIGEWVERPNALWALKLTVVP
jgi:hypothetical protein